MAPFLLISLQWYITQHRKHLRFGFRFLLLVSYFKIKCYSVYHILCCGMLLPPWILHNCYQNKSYCFGYTNIILVTGILFPVYPLKTSGYMLGTKFYRFTDFIKGHMYYVTTHVYRRNWHLYHYTDNISVLASQVIGISSVYSLVYQD